MELKNNYLYLIKARNADKGVWIEAMNGFVIRRVKFGMVYLFVEIHYDKHEKYGTATPLKEIERCPIKIEVTRNVELEKMPRDIYSALLAYLE